MKRDYKDLNDKLPMQHIKPICYEAISLPMLYGIKKYGIENKLSFEYGEVETYIGGMLRHLNKYRSGQLIDNESGIPHLWSALFNMYACVLLDSKENKFDVEQWIKERK